MREIKFRCWDGVSLIYPDERGRFNGVTLPAYAVRRDLGLTSLIKYGFAYQFTGFKDRVSKDIYEGDILETKQNIISIEWGRQDRKIKGWPAGLDEFEMHGWIARGLNGTHTEPLDDTMYGENGGIVIGNIYENPELLK